MDAKDWAAAEETLTSCEIVVLLDRSGSMSKIKNDMEGGFNTFISEQKKLPGEAFLTLVQFDSGGIDTIYSSSPIQEIESIKIIPRGRTPLLDAMGQVLGNTETKFKVTGVMPKRAIFLIVTDGEENHSSEWTKEAIQALVLRLEKEYGWVFSYLGANVDAFAEAHGIGVVRENAANYTPNAKGIRSMFSTLSANVGTYRSGGQYSLSDKQRAEMDEEFKKKKSTI